MSQEIEKFQREDNPGLAIPEYDLPSEDTKPPDQPFFIPTDDERGVYRFILAAAKRARQLQAGARPTISTTSRKPTRIAMEEIRGGAVEVEIYTVDEPNTSSVLMEQPSAESLPEVQERLAAGHDLSGPEEPVVEPEDEDETTKEEE